MHQVGNYFSLQYSQIHNVGVLRLNLKDVVEAIEAGLEFSKKGLVIYNRSE